MKKRNLRKNGKAEIIRNKNKNSAITIDMKERRNIRIYIPEEVDMSESENLQFQMLAQKQYEEIKRTYYSLNTPISSTINRTFFDFFKQFIQLKLENFNNRVKLKRI